MTDEYQEELLRRDFEEIRARYTQLLRELLEKGEVLPDWALNPAAACACGDKCSTGSTDLDRLSSRVLPTRPLGSAQG
jgi:hypothetical protein